MELNGKVVFSSGRTTDFDIWVLELETKHLTQLTFGEQLNDMPRWSPDGKKICFIRTGEDLIASLYVMDSSGANQTRLTTTCHAQYPSWSPDGRQIVFTANAGDNKNEIDICVCSLETKEVSVLLKRKGSEFDPSFSPDGRKLLFAAIDPDSQNPYSERDTEIWEYDLAEKTERKICAHPARDSSPVYSPGGTQIAFVSHRKGESKEAYLARLAEIQAKIDITSKNSVEQSTRELEELEQGGDIYLVNTDGTNLRQVSNHRGSEVGVRWSPCGRYLIYSAFRGKQHEKQRLRVIDLSSGEDLELDFDRTPLMREIGASPDDYLNKHLFLKLIPDVIEKPFMERFIGSMYWGEERWPDWI